ncbi:MAG: hypothetical protein HQ564_06685 [Candidatus Saganbacteria bacterium]|nr:hypothetical protein [Candidatus Saganbacteria bacterium]
MNMSSVSNLSRGSQIGQTKELAGLAKEITNVLGSKTKSSDLFDKGKGITQNEKINVSLLAKQEFSKIGRNVHEMA